MPVALRLAHGGPFFELQRKLGLLQDDNLNVRKRAAIFVALTWLVPLLLTIPMSNEGTRSYLVDPGPSTRFLIAICCFIVAENMIERRVDEKLTQLSKGSLIAPKSMGGLHWAIRSAIAQRDAVLAEIICLIVAVIAGGLALATYKQTDVSTWAAQIQDGQPVLTLAGWWCVAVSIPLFTFLCIRGLWRHLILVALLHRISRLELRLVVTHPDKKGGLAFFGNYPNSYALFVFGVSSAVAAALWKHTLESSVSGTTLTTVMGAWLLLVFANFSAGLLAFTRPLGEVKEVSVYKFSNHALVFERASEKKSLGENVVADDPVEPGLEESRADVAKNYEQARKLSTLLIDRSILLPIAASALLPFAGVGVAHLPLKEVLSVFKKLILL